ncbi:hypothetical protein DXA68_00100 [Bacteroides stercorirosoris]|uniref:Uncharacterized protein n=1 Tax=Bacteroides stercorirosoris TaxID=871324 RepID=A0A413HBJ6_9BACE|nr:hypothetical protein DXA68_00100 [Bacteroides stercorirosoris]
MHLQFSIPIFSNIPKERRKEHILKLLKIQSVRMILIFQFILLHLQNPVRKKDMNLYVIQ